MADDTKVEEIRAYLQKTFPASDIKSRSRGAIEHDFKISRGGASFQLIVKRTFLETHSLEEIGQLLNDWNVGTALRRSATACVVLGNGGVTEAWPSQPA